MKLSKSYVIGLFVLLSAFVFSPLFISGKIPIPTDALVGLYHPFRDYYMEAFPRGVPFKNFLITDPVRQQYPFRFLAIGQMRNFQLPLWNPYNFAGSPLLANIQAAPFYPLNLIFLLLPFSFAWTVLVFLQPVLMGVFMFCYLRKIGASYIGGFFGGVAYALSGFSVAWMEWNTVVHTALWLPLVLLSVEHLLTKIKFKWVAIFMFAFCSQFLAGHLQTAFYLTLLSALYIFWKVFDLSREHAKDRPNFAFRKISPFVIMFFTTLAITFVQWFPALQFINNSARDIDRIFWLEAGWFIPYMHLIQFVAPDFFGNPATLNYWGIWNYAELVGYIGMIPLLLVIFALISIKRKLVWFYGAVILVSLVFSLPTPIAVLPFSSSLPFLSTAQPTRLIFLIDFSLAVLAGLGITRFEKSSKKFLIPLIIVGILLAFLWISIFYNYPFVTGSENLQVAKRNLILPTMLFAISCGGFLSTFFLKNKKYVIIVPLLFVVVTVFDLTRFAQKFFPFSDPEYLYPRTKTLEFLENQEGSFRVLSRDDRILPPNTNIMYRLQSVEGYDPLFLRRYAEFIAASERGEPTIAAPFGFNRIITPENISSHLIDLLGAKYVLSLNEVDEKGFVKVYQEGQTIVYENKEVFPRVFSVTSIVQANTKEEAIGQLFTRADDLREIAIVEGYLGEKDFSQADVELIEYKENFVTVKSSSDGPAFIVLMDSFYPTWKAAVIGNNGEKIEELPIYLTNYNFRGIIVPAGDIKVEFYNTLF